MPWCEDCERYLTVPSLGHDGACPACGRVLVAKPRAPWHFKVLVAAAGGYLALRAAQGLEWMFQRM